MSEKIPDVELYDEEGRVRDADAAQEMADLESRHREFDKERFFEPRKKELEEREARLTEVGNEILGQKKKETERLVKYAQAEAKRQEEREEFVKRNLLIGGISQEKWDSLPLEEQSVLERKWRREAEKSPEYFLEQRLETLIGKKISSFEVGDGGHVELNFDDDTILSFNSWNTYDDEADYDSVQVTNPKAKESGK